MEYRRTSSPAVVEKVLLGVLLAAAWPCYGDPTHGLQQRCWSACVMQMLLVRHKEQQPTPSHVAVQSPDLAASGIRRGEMHGCLV